MHTYRSEVHHATHWATERTKPPDKIQPSKPAPAIVVFGVCMWVQAMNWDQRRTKMAFHGQKYLAQSMMGLAISNIRVVLLCDWLYRSSKSKTKILKFANIYRYKYMHNYMSVSVNYDVSECLSICVHTQSFTYRLNKSQLNVSDRVLINMFGGVYMYIYIFR